MVMPVRWLRYIPEGPRSQPVTIPLATLCFMSGVSAAAGVVKASDPVQSIMPEYFVRGWGVVLCIATLAWVWGVVKNDMPSEKVGLRLFALSLVSYVVAIFASSGRHITLGALVIGILCLWFVVWAEVRVAVIKAFIKPWQLPERKVR
jgi:hypothetical protein